MSDESTESERRFLVSDTSMVAGAAWQQITQAYVFSQDGFSIRVRLVEEPVPFSSELTPVKAIMTGKGPDHGYGRARKRDEYEADVKVDWAWQVIDRCSLVIRKRRYHIVTTDTWDVDEFLGNNEGLWIAEIEGGAAIEDVRKPVWLGQEISKDDRYDNDQLVLRPWTDWS